MGLDRRLKQKHLLDQIQLAADLLPSQGPISAFASLNPLQGLESLPFDEAMRKAKQIYGCEPYLEETRYLAKVRSGRIAVEDLRCIIAKDLGAEAKRSVANLMPVEQFRLQLVAHAIHCGDHWDIFRLFFGHDVFVVDELSAPLLPLTALLYFLAIISTPQSKAVRFPFLLALFSEAVGLALVSCNSTGLIISFLGLSMIPLWIELQDRRQSTRSFSLHMGLYVLLLLAGWMLIELSEKSGGISVTATILLLMASVLRAGIIPVHPWITDLFERASFGTALLYVTPMSGAYAVMRLVLPVAPTWAMQSIAILSLITAVYAAGMAVVQSDMRRFFCYLFLSQSSLVFAGLEISNTVGMTGALCTWLSVGLSLGGLGLIMRMVEARIGSVSLKRYHGLFEHMPLLASLFLLTGLSSIGFPGTLGFVGMELLVEGTVEFNPLVGAAVVLAAALNGIAILRAYFLIFTGTRHVATISLAARRPEKFAAILLSLLVLGGILIGLLSGSHTSVSGPAAGLTAIVAVQIAGLGSFRTFLLVVVVAGAIQIVLGIVQAGALSAFFPSSVIKGLLAAIGTILIIKQIPYLLGYDMIAKGPVPGHSNILTQLEKLFSGNMHAGAAAIGGVSMAILLVWERVRVLKHSLVPGQLVVVVVGVLLGFAANLIGDPWGLHHAERFMVNVPVAQTLAGFLDFLTLPDFSQWANPAVYVAGLTLATVASLETLLNLDAVDKLDKKQRLSPPSRELWAQGVGNIACGLLGGIPVTSVVIRGSVNVGAGSATKLSAVFHGLFLLLSVMLVPTWLNKIPLSCLAAILLVTGFKLASPKLMSAMWREGASQFVPFMVTLLAIVATDLLMGITIGFGFSLLFILASNLRLPIRQIVEKHVGGEVQRIELANQVSFLNRAALERVLRKANSGAHLLLDARRTDYIDPDILSLIREFREITAPANGVQVSLRGFKSKYRLQDNIQFVDYTTRELQSQLTPDRVLRILVDGNERFRTGNRLDRERRVSASGETRKEHPIAVIFSGTDPRTPAEMVFDLGLGDAYSIRMAGNVIGPNAIGSMEYGCIVGGAKLILVLGHTQSGLVELAIRESCLEAEVKSSAQCPNLGPILSQINKSIDLKEGRRYLSASPAERIKFVNEVSRRNIVRGIEQIMLKSPAIRQLVTEQKLAVVGAMLDIDSGSVEFLTEAADLCNSHNSN